MSMHPRIWFFQHYPLLLNRLCPCLCPGRCPPRRRSKQTSDRDGQTPPSRAIDSTSQMRYPSLAPEGQLSTNPESLGMCLLILHQAILQATPNLHFSDTNKDSPGFTDPDSHQNALNVELLIEACAAGSIASLRISLGNRLTPVGSTVYPSAGRR
jgi:hypothetical protein